MDCQQRSAQEMKRGEDSISWATPKKTQRGWVIRWEYKSMIGGLLFHYTTGGKTVSIARQRARRRAKRIREYQGYSYDVDDRLAEYIRVVAMYYFDSKWDDSMTTHKQQRKERVVLRCLRGECPEYKQHTLNFAILTIAEAVKPVVLFSMLQDILRVHGDERAKDSGKVLSEYLYARLINKGIIDFYPLGDNYLL